MRPYTQNRYAWTDSGPVELIQGAWTSKKVCREYLYSAGIEVRSFTRNWTPFIGWITRGFLIPAGGDQIFRELSREEMRKIWGAQ